MLSRAQNTFHHNPRLRGPVSSIKNICKATPKIFKVSIPIGHQEMHLEGNSLFDIRPCPIVKHYPVTSSS